VSISTEKGLLVLAGPGSWLRAMWGGKAREIMRLLLWENPKSNSQAAGRSHLIDFMTARTGGTQGKGNVGEERSPWRPLFMALERKIRGGNSSSEWKIRSPRACCFRLVSRSASLGSQSAAETGESQIDSVPGPPPPPQVERNHPGSIQRQKTPLYKKTYSRRERKEGRGRWKFGEFLYTQRVKPSRQRQKRKWLSWTLLFP